jgi:hypothetical protein
MFRINRIEKKLILSPFPSILPYLADIKAATREWP